MRPVELVGVNGDRIPLTGPEYCVAVEATFGTTRPKVAYRSSLAGRRVDQITQDLVVSVFDVTVTGSTVTEHDTARGRLIDALRATGAPVTLIVERADGSRRAQIGYDLGDDSPIRDNSVWRSRLPVVLESVEHPYWVALEADVAETSIGVASSTPWVLEMPIGAAVPIGWPWSISGYYIADANAITLEISNVGALPTWPVWEIDGPASTVELAHERTGLVTRWAGSLVAGETLKIVTDPHRRAVTQDTVSGWAGVALNSNFSPLLNGRNEIQVGVTGGVDGQTNVRVTSHARFTSA